jgi:hypothetical protein
MATNFKWIGGTNNWNDFHNWTPAGSRPPGTGGNVSDSATLAKIGTLTYDLSSDTIAGLTISNAGATLTSLASDTLTVSGTTTISAGTLDLLNSGAVLNTGSLTSSSGSVIDVGNGATLNAIGGASPQIALGGLLESTSGLGIVNGSIGGSGTIEATGGTLDIAGSLIANTLTLAADSVGSSVLELEGTVAAGTDFRFLNSGAVYAGGLLLANTTAQASFENGGTIFGMHVGSSATVPTDYIDLGGVVPTSFTSSSIANGNTIDLFNGATLAAHFTLSSAVASGTFVDWTTDASGGTDIFLSDAPCYVAGTRILTERGEVAVERLRVGDRVITVAGKSRVLQPIKWMGRRRLDLTTHPRPATAAPIRIGRGAFADNVPARDLLVSPDHAIFVDGVLIAARQLVNRTTIRQETGRASVDYFHVELDSHAILLAEGLPAESYLDTANRGFFSNSGDPLTLHPDLTEDRSELSRAAGACAPFVVDEASVRPVWERLADRSAALGHAAVAAATTTDADLHLVVKGRQIRPIYGQNGLFLFPLPVGATGVRLRSRAASPADARPWLDDRRELGVSVARLTLRTAEEVLEIPVDHPDLADGWWDVEREASAAMHRWTDGNALIALPASRGHWMLEVQLHGEMTYPVETADAAERRVA